MIGQNDFSSQSSNFGANGAIASSGSNTSSISNQALTNGTAPKPNEQSSNKRLFIVGGSCLLAGLLIAAVIYFVALKPQENDKQEEIDSRTYSTEVVDNKSKEEFISDFDNRISSAKDDAEKLENTFDKAMFYIMTDDYDSALTVLDGISESGLSDFDLYRLYNHYTSAYQGKGDTAQAEKYQKLAEEAQSRDFSSYQSSTAGQ